MGTASDGVRCNPDAADVSMSWAQCIRKRVGHEKGLFIAGDCLSVEQICGELRETLVFSPPTSLNTMCSSL